LDQPGCTSNSPQWRVRPNKQSNFPLCELDRTSSPTRPFGELDQLVCLPSSRRRSSLLYNYAAVLPLPSMPLMYLTENYTIRTMLDGVDEDELSRLSLSSFVVLGVISHTAACGVGLLWRESINNSRCRHNSEWLHNIRSINSISDLSTSPSKEIAGMIKQKLVETEHSSLSGAVPAFDGRKNIYSPVEFQEDRLEFLANLPISSCNT
ncbi:unnamed protein product, partial [Brassica oleracea var. botrytis]